MYVGGNVYTYIFVMNPYNTEKLPFTFKFYRVNKLYHASMKLHYFSNRTIMYVLWIQIFRFYGLLD